MRSPQTAPDAGSGGVDIAKGNADVRDRIESANRQAAEARKKALECADQHVKEQWMKVALMWEELARECREVEKARAQSLHPESTPS